MRFVARRVWACRRTALTFPLTFPVSGLVGLDAEFVRREVAMLDSIRKGTFVIHHLEPSYFAAMSKAVDEELGRAMND